MSDEIELLFKLVDVGQISEWKFKFERIFEKDDVVSLLQPLFTFERIKESDKLNPLQRDYDYYKKRSSEYDAENMPKWLLQEIEYSYRKLQALTTKLNHKEDISVSNNTRNIVKRALNKLSNPKNGDELSFKSISRYGDIEMAIKGENKICMDSKYIVTSTTNYSRLIERTSKLEVYKRN